MTLSATNTYTGNTTITGGTLVVTNNASLGAIPGGSVTVNGGTLDLGGNLTNNNLNFGAKQFIISGSGPAGLGALYNSGTSQQNAFQSVTLIGDATVGGSNAGGSAGRMDIRATVGFLDLQGHTLTKTGSSQFTLVATSVTSTVGGPGAIVVNGGMLGLETTTNVQPANVSSITMDDNTRLEFFSNTATASTITSPVIIAGSGVVIGPGNSGPIIGSPITLEADVTFQPITTNAPSDAASNLTWTGNIGESGGSYGLAKSGTGNATLTLSGTGTYTGNTVINGGTLLLNNPLAIGGSTLNYNNQGGALSFGSLTNATFGGLSGAQSLALTNTVGAAVALTVGPNNFNTTYSGTLSGAGATLTKSGTGTLALTGSNSYTGGTTVSAGTLAVGHVNALGTGGLTINSMATAQLQTGTGAGPVVLPSVSIAGGVAPTGTLDITNSKMVHYQHQLCQRPCRPTRWPGRKSPMPWMALPGTNPASPAPRWPTTLITWGCPPAWR